MNRIKGLLATARALAGTPLGAQVGRFVRLAVVSAFTAWVAAGQQVSKAAIFGAIVGGAEVAYRAFRPALTGSLLGSAAPNASPPYSAVTVASDVNSAPSTGSAASASSAPPADYPSPNQGL